MNNIDFIEYHIGNAHYNPNIDNDYLSQLLDLYYKERLKDKKACQVSNIPIAELMRMPKGTVCFYETNKTADEFAKNLQAYASNAKAKITSESFLAYTAVGHEPVTIVKATVLKQGVELKKRGRPIFKKKTK